MVTGHKVPGHPGETAHSLDRLSDSDVRELLFIEDVAGQKHIESLLLGGDLAETINSLLARILEQRCHLWLEKRKGLSNLKVGGMDEPHLYQLPVCSRSCTSMAASEVH
jgi:hypothetical protein